MTKSNVIVDGSVAPGFEPVQALFVEFFEKGTEENAQVCVYHKGQRVVDLWGSAKKDLTYKPSTLTNVWSSTKSVTAIVIAMGVDRGFLNYGAKVTEYWPEFAKNGKSSLTLSDVLRHEGGMPSFSKTIPLPDTHRENIKNNNIGAIIAEERQHYPPEEANTKRQYHAITRGWILNEIFRRAEPNGRTIGEFLREEIAGPLGIDVNIGVDEAQLGQFTDLTNWSIPYVVGQSLLPSFMGKKIDASIVDMIMIAKMLKPRSNSSDFKPAPALEGMDKPNPSTTIQKFNEKATRMGEIPSANGSCSARGLATLGACILNGGEWEGKRILKPETIKSMTAHPKTALDAVLGNLPTDFTQGGVNIFTVHPDTPTEMQERARPREGFVGWMGFGGSVFQWHPKSEISFAFVPNMMHYFDMSNARGGKLQKLAIECAQKLG